MNTLIVYASKYGSAEKCAAAIAQKLTGNVDRCDVKKDEIPALSKYGKIVIGGSVYMGQIQKGIRDFCSQHLAELKEKQIGLFICCMQTGETAEAELKSSFSPELLLSAAACEPFQGDLIFSKMKAMDRFIAKMVAKTDKDIFNIREDTVAEFVQKMNNA